MNLAGTSDSGTSRGGSKPHTSSSLMSGQEENSENGGARPRPSDDGGSQPSLAGSKSYKCLELSYVIFMIHLNLKALQVNSKSYFGFYLVHHIKGFQLTRACIPNAF